MTTIEKDFFKIITGYDYEELNADDVNVKISIDRAQACAREYEEGLRGTWIKSRRTLDEEGIVYEFPTFEDYLKTLKEQ